MEKARVLIVDDEEIMREALKTSLEESDLELEIDEASDGKEAAEKIEKNKYDLIISDVRMPGLGGIDLLKFVKEKSDESLVILMTAYGNIEMAVSAMKLGAYDFITKPFSYDKLLSLVKKALFHKKSREKNPYLKTTDLKERYFKLNILGKSKAMLELFELIDRVSKSDANIFLHGESGTGKSLIARAIHESSFRAGKPFIAVNCAALPETLLESELFGHVKGAFTGAIKDKPGRFEMADGGTIFLDEIGEISPLVQVKLLRVLQERKFERVGDIKTREVDVRIIAATNKDLRAAVERGEFREDLYYRINVIPLEIPPLRERPEDIELLSNHFLKIFAAKNNKNIQGISPEVMKLFKKYRWPGNVRELENTIERMVVLETEEILTTKYLPLEIKEGSFLKQSCECEADVVFNKIMPLEELEKKYIKYVLEKLDWNYSKTARLLAIDRKTLYNKVNKYGFKKEEEHG